MTLPFVNDTGKIEKTLAKRSLAADRRRNAVAMLTIGLAVCLMSLVAFYYTASYVRTVESLRGHYQSGCGELSYDDLARLDATGKLERWGYQSETHSIRYKDANVSVQFYDSEMLDLMQAPPITGRYPEAENEICIERAFLKYFNLPQEEGTPVSLDLGDGERTFVVSGILEAENDSRYFEAYISEALAVAMGGENPFTIRFRFAGSSEEAPEQLRAEIAAFYEEMGIAEETIFYSSNYFDLNEMYLGSDLYVYGIALLIAVVCAIVIYNIFYISVMGKLREYGRLKVIGTTPRQLRRVVRRERRALMWISIPSGIAAAMLIMFVTARAYWRWEKNLPYMVFIVLLTIAMVAVATRKPLQLAGQVSAIEAVRSNAYQALSGVSRRLHRPLSIFRLAGMNFTRNRRKTAITLVSLGLTGILTACIASYADSVDARELARNAFGDGGSYIVELESNKTMYEAQLAGLLNEQTQARLLALPDVEFLTVWSGTLCMVEESPRADALYDLGGFTKEQMAALSENNLLLEGTADYDTLAAQNGILVTRDSENLLKKLYHLDLSVGDSVTVKSNVGIAKTYTVMGIVDFVKGASYNAFVLPEEELHVLYPKVADFTECINIHTVQTSDAQRQQLYAVLDDPRVSVASLEDLVLSTEMNLRQMMLMLYGMNVFIALFALVNFINTMMTNLLTRQQEFGIFQSVGMTNRQLSRMISCECLWYVGVTLLITLTLGTACGAATVRAFHQVGLFGSMTYHFPAAALLVFAAALFAVHGAFSLFAVRFLQSRSLVERIKAME